MLGRGKSRFFFGSCPIFNAFEIFVEEFKLNNLTKHLQSIIITDNLIKLYILKRQLPLF